MKTTINDINNVKAQSKEHVEVRCDEWETGSGWSIGDSCEYDYDPEHQHTRDDLVDFVDDQLQLLLDGYSREERLQHLKAYADDSISDTRYTMTVYAAHDDYDDDYDYDEPITEYRVWLSDVAKRLLADETDG